MADVIGGPLGPGDPVAHWRLGAIHEARYDIPDAPMAGEMDPFFFLSEAKNFIPHEYPCRTRFARERRGKRPETTGDPAPVRWWLPFGSPRVDLSSFWFRPTTIACWAETALLAATAGPARFRLGTCGGAILFVNDREAGWLASYVRNLEESTEIAVELKAGRNALAVFFDDLAERDTRFMFELDYLGGPACSVALEAPMDGTGAREIERLLDGLRFERSAYQGGDVAILLPGPLPLAATADLDVGGEGISGAGIHLGLPKGAARLDLGPSETLPADFRTVEVTLNAGGFVASRRLAVEICHAGRQGEPPASLHERAAEALDYVSANGEPDTVTALARLATGRGGDESNGMIARALPAIEDCHDCADFALVPLLWARQRWGTAIAPTLRERIDRAILGYRYWMDEPGNDVQWYFSENHALLFHASAYLAGAMFPDATFDRSRRAGREQSQIGLERLRGWFDHFERWEMAEFNSAPYFPIDLKGLAALAALAPDTDIGDRASRAIVRLLEIVARSAHHGILTGAQGRSYEHSLRPARTAELSAIARLVWGRGWFGERVHALPLMALLIRDHGFEPPPGLAAVADLTGDGAVEWRFAQGQDRIAKLYHYKSRDFAMGTAATYRWNEWGYQETLLHLRLGTTPEAQVWINHPGEVIHAGTGRPSFWGGSGTIPRVQQYRGLAVMVFDTEPGQPDFTHAWFPIEAFDAYDVRGDVAVATSGDGTVVLKASGPLELITEGPSANTELRLRGRKAWWLVRTSSREFAAELRAQAAIMTVKIEPDGAIAVDDAQYGRIIFRADGAVEAEDRTLRPAEWTIRGETTQFSGA
jgi:hypothetical protein